MSDLASRLNAAGVGRRYHEARMSQMGKPGTDALDWVDNQMEAQLKVGGGLTIHGGGEAAVALTQGLTRLLVLMEVRCKLMRLLPLLDAVRADEAPGYETVLIVLGFHSAGYRSPPLPVGDQIMIEDYLNERLDRNMCTFIHAATDPREWGAWWSSEVVSRLVLTNTDIQAKG